MQIVSSGKIRKKNYLKLFSAEFFYPAFSSVQYFLFFPKQKIGLAISYKLSFNDIICIKCQTSFQGKNKKTITSLSSAEFAQRVLIVNASSVTLFQLIMARTFCSQAQKRIDQNISDIIKG